MKALLKALTKPRFHAPLTGNAKAWETAVYEFLVKEEKARIQAQIAQAQEIW